MTPCLRGHHNTIDSWREGRDLEGWKNNKDSNESTWVDVLNHNLTAGKTSDEEHDLLYQSHSDKDKPPLHVLLAPRLFDDLEMLEGMFKEDVPTRFPIRHRKVAEVCYGFYDASGRGLGSSFQGSDESKVTIRIGVWSTSVSEDNSSN